VEETVRQRPWRPKFFAAFARALNANVDSPLDILELGSGPGHLAEHILNHCPLRKYVALDFSNAMHALARARLETFQSKIDFVQIDFRESDWPNKLGKFSAVVTMQAAHEMRHKNHLTKFLSTARGTLRKSGLLLYCDHYAEAGSAKNEELFVSREAQPKALQAAGFVRVQRILDEGGMALYAGYKS
jgi:cyclopropane fatty-acyl-phospholipid synthase-like methyltransferase